MSLILALDETVVDAVQALRSPALTALMRGWTLLGGTLFVSACVLVAAAFAWRRGRPRVAADIVALTGGGALLSTLTKLLVERARPLGSTLIPMPSSHSFPSGHAMASLCLAAALVYAIRAMGQGRRMTCIAAVAGVVYALGVAFSRVYLGVHWPTDIIGSWALGGMWSLVVLYGAGRATDRA